MSETKYYAIDPDSLEGCRIRVSFHFKELQRETNSIVRANIAQYLAEATVSFHFKELQQETNSIVRANIAQYLAEATATLALLEVEEARRIAI